MKHDEREALNLIFDSLVFADDTLELLLTDGSVDDNLTVNETLKEFA